MNQSSTVSTGRSTIRLNRIKTYFSKPHNVILLIMGIVLTVTTVAPIVAIVQDTFKIHAGTIDAHLTGQASGYTAVNYIDLFTSSMAKSNLWMPLLNTVWLAVGTCVVSILFGGLFAFLITRTNLAWRKYLSSIFIFPYIMPQWTLAVVWQNLFNSNAVTGTSNGLLAATLGVQMPLWWCKGLFPSLVVLGLHYAPFAYILIGGIFRNMDANLEEAATILDTPKWKTMFKITLPMVKPAILSTILLVFGSSMGSYPVPHYLGLTTLATKYVSLNSKYTGEASILAIIMMIFGVAIMFLNQMSLRSRKNYTTVTGKSGQTSKINLGRAGKHIIAAVLIVPLLIAVSLLYTKTAHTPEWEEVLVPAGQRSELRLADGTLLWLNSGTRVTYPTHFNGRQRKIFVDGEVYAEVMHDKRHPFVISAGDVEVEVLGTKFNMRAYNSDQLVEVALVEGSVRFDVNSDKCNDEVVMVRNDVAQYDRLTGALEMTSFQSENYKSRATGGGFYFFNESLDGITAQLARCFDQKIIITDPELAGVRFYAFFTNNESLLKILGTLNTDKSMSIRERNDVIYISRKK